MTSFLAQDQLQTPRPRRARGRLLDRFKRSQDGATMVEFALVLTPFLMLIFAIMETALMFWTSQILEEAVTQASRKLLTGQALTRYTGNATANSAAFRNDVCALAPTSLIDCSKLTIDARAYTSFANAKAGTSSSNPVAGGALNTTGFGYNAAQAGQVVVVRAVLDYKLFFSQWSTALVNIGNGGRGIVATAVFRTEPFTAPAT